MAKISYQLWESAVNLHFIENELPDLGEEGCRCHCGGLGNQCRVLLAIATSVSIIETSTSTPTAVRPLDCDPRQATSLMLVWDTMVSELGPMIGQGRAAEVYAWGNDQVVKLFWPRTRLENVNDEMRDTRVVHDAGLPVPAVGGLVEVDGRPGILFERIDGPSMLEHMLSRPWRIPAMARLLAELQAKMHAVETAELEPRKDGLRVALREHAVFPDWMRDAVIERLAQLPEGNAICHGDLHPDNIIMSDRGPVIIDWSDATRCSPMYDVARTWFLLRMSAVPEYVRAHWLINLLRRVLHRIYLRHYRRLRPSPRRRQLPGGCRL